MNIFVLYDRSGLHSGRALGQGLMRALTGVEVAMGRPEHLASLLASGRKFDYIVNVGWFGRFDSDGAVVLNRPGSIAVSSNKLKARQKFIDKGISAPTLWENFADIPDKEFPVIARTTHHSKGRGFWFCKSPREAQAAARGGTVTVKKRILTRKGNRVWRERTVRTDGASHFIKFIPNTREFRVHVMCTKSDNASVTAEDYVVLKLSEKIQGPQGTRSNIVKNHENGWIFSFPKNNEDPILSKVRDEGKKALAAFGLHWGAVDIIVSNDTGRVYVLEINSTPCLTDDQANTLDKYVKGVGRLVGTFKPFKKKKPAADPVNKKRNLGELFNKVGL